MAISALAPGPASEDPTARARIRQAALAQFTEHGFARATIRGIAAAAGVSLGPVRHHFGSKQALRDAVDAHVLLDLYSHALLSPELAASARAGLDNLPAGSSP